jgi:hypothetical protein
VGGVSKADGRKHTKHASYYGSLPPRIEKRKDRNVVRSSHGKFTREALRKHQEKVEGSRKPKIRVKVRKIECPLDRWIKYIPANVEFG